MAQRNGTFGNDLLIGCVGDELISGSAGIDTALAFPLPVKTFSDTDGDTLTLTAALANGDSLPARLSFDPAAGSGLAQAAAGIWRSAGRSGSSWPGS